MRIACQVLLLLLFAMTTLSVNAQRFVGGVVAGVNLSQIDGDRLAGFHKIGFNAGGKVGAKLSDRWQLSLELLFSQQGARRVINDDPAAVYDDIRLNFVEAPVMINFKEWKFHVSAGVSYARLINFKVIDIFGADVTSLQNYNENIFSIHLGGTYYFNNKIGMEVRWFKSLNNLQALEGAGNYIGRSVSCRAIYLF